jgi:hypothetical protein
MACFLGINDTVLNTKQKENQGALIILEQMSIHVYMTTTAILTTTSVYIYTYTCVS